MLATPLLAGDTSETSPEVFANLSSPKILERNAMVRSLC